jgi:Bacterial regulatory proteins, luxR family
MFLVEVTGRLVHANAAGHVMLKEADIFRVSSGGLTTGDRHAARTLAGKANCAFCLAVVEVGGVPEVAEALGVAETTVKTHLGRLYQKIGARRQADLVKVVAGFSNPFCG